MYLKILRNLGKPRVRMGLGRIKSVLKVLWEEENERR